MRLLQYFGGKFNFITIVRLQVEIKRAEPRTNNNAQHGQGPPDHGPPPPHPAESWSPMPMPNGHPGAPATPVMHPPPPTHHQVSLLSWILNFNQRLYTPAASFLDGTTAPLPSSADLLSGGSGRRGDGSDGGRGAVGSAPVLSRGSATASTCNHQFCGAASSPRRSTPPPSPCSSAPGGLSAALFGVSAVRWASGQQSPPSAPAAASAGRLGPASPSRVGAAAPSPKRGSGSAGRGGAAVAGASVLGSPPAATAGPPAPPPHSAPAAASPYPAVYPPPSTPQPAPPPPHQQPQQSAYWGSPPPGAHPPPPHQVSPQIGSREIQTDNLIVISVASLDGGARRASSRHPRPVLRVGGGGDVSGTNATSSPAAISRDRLIRSEKSRFCLMFIQAELRATGFTG